MDMPADAPIVFVSPAGNDRWSGRLAAPDSAGHDGPMATLRVARDAARRFGVGSPRRIVLQAGDYFVDEPLELRREDSGLTIEAAGGARAAVIGGRRITGWAKDGERFWAAPVPEAAAGKWDFRMLVVNGRFCERARLPREGHFTHLSTFDVPWMSTTGGGWKRKPTPAELTTLKYRPEDLGPWFDIRNAEITVYHMWDESMVGVASMDREAHTLTISNPAGHPPGAFGVQTYDVSNVREGMTRPGQWYLDRAAGRVVYWPLPGDDMAQVVALAPAAESIVRIAGTEAEPVRNVAIRGLSLSVTHTPLRAGGFGASAFDGAVSIQWADDCALSDLEIANTGGQGIKADRVRRLRVEGCEVHHTGAGGILVGGEDVSVSDNRVHDVGILYPSAIAVWALRGKGIAIRHNDIHDTPYSAIDVSGEDHRIEHNRITRAMLKLHDGAGIYITFCKRIELRGNFIHDLVDTGGYGASAYYLDEQAEDCLVEGNVAVRVATPSHNHMATRNTIRGNVFVMAGDARLTFPRSSGYTFEKNVLRAEGSITITNPEAIAAFRSNVVFSATGRIEGAKLKDYAPSPAEPLRVADGNVFADPGLASFEDGRIVFAADSPAIRLGLTPVDVSGAGCRRGKPAR